MHVKSILNKFFKFTKHVHWFTILGFPFLSESIADHLYNHFTTKKLILKIIYSKQPFISLYLICVCSANLIGNFEFVDSKAISCLNNYYFYKVITNQFLQYYLAPIAKIYAQDLEIKQ